MWIKLPWFETRFSICHQLLCVNFGPVLILIQINENKKRKCPSLGEGGGYSCLPVKRDGRVGFQNKCIFYFHFYLLQVHWHLIFLSFLMITELYLFKRHWIYRYITICTYFNGAPNFSYFFHLLLQDIYLFGGSNDVAKVTTPFDDIYKLSLSE